MKSLMRLWLRLRYCPVHRKDKTRFFGLHTSWDECGDCKEEKAKRRITKRDARIARYYR